MLKRAVSVLMLITMLFSMSVGFSTASYTLSDTDSYDSYDTDDGQALPGSALSSAYACDVGENICCSDSGDLVYEGETLVRGVGQILYADGCIYYAKGENIYTYDLSAKKTSKQVYSGSDEVICFSLYKGKLYVYDRCAISAGGETLLDMTAEMHALTGNHNWTRVSLSDCLSFCVEDEKNLLLYFVNPEFDEYDAYNEIEPYLVFGFTKGKDYLAVFTEEDDSSFHATPSYNADTSYTIGKASYPLAEYPVGSFFTKNGKSCTCHNQGICVASGSNCNCMRYWPTGKSSTCEIDLMSSQCWGFAEFCEYRAYGYYDKSSPNSFTNAFGSKITTGSWTANTVKQTLTSAGAGGHLRIGGHSLFVISVSTTGFITYECNKSTSGNYCVIYTNSWTWDSFYSKKRSSDIFWYYIPKDASSIPIVNTTYETGNYQVKASSLNLRANPSTSAAILASIPNDTIIQITEFNSAYTWGKTTYGGQTGWVSLDYVFYLTSNVMGIYIENPPDKTVYVVDDTFSTEGLEVYARFIDGTTAEISGYTCTGYNLKKVGTYTVTVTYMGYSASFTITVQPKQIYPTSIKLSDTTLALLEGDSYNLSYTILPNDANMLGVTWKSSNAAVASVNQSGYVETYKEGVATISVTTVNNLTASCTVTVVKMPSGTSWSVDYKGNPLNALPLGITPLDYSVRYRVLSGTSYGDWVYLNVGDDLPVSSLAGKSVQYQYRAVTASFISDGRDAFDPFPVDVNTTIDLSKYTLEKDGFLFAGWFKSGQAALALDQSMAYGSTVRVTGDLAFYAGWIALGSLDADQNDFLASSPSVESFEFAGTGLCDVSGSMGIRFFSRISTELVNNLKKLNGKCEYGSVVILKNKLGSSLVISGSSMTLSSNKPVKSVATKTYESFDGALPDDSDDYIIYDVLVTGYTDNYIKTDVAVRPYIIYRDANGVSHTYYYTCIGDSTKSGAYYTNLYDVALAAYDSSDNKIWIRENILDKVN